MSLSAQLARVAGHEEVVGMLAEKANSGPGAEGRVSNLGIHVVEGALALCVLAGVSAIFVLCLLPGSWVHRAIVAADWF